MSSPAVSVVMGVYNGTDLLAESIDSILDQEGVDLELVVVDDGSTDGAGVLLDRYGARDRRVRVIHQENSGLTKTLIRACLEAQGRYIARQDCGDFSLPGRLARQKETLDAAPRLSFVSCWTEFCGPELEPLHVARGSGKSAAPTNLISPDFPDLMIDGPSHHGSVMFRKSCYDRVGGYRPAFYFGQDWDLWCRLAETGTFQMIPEILYRARLMPGSISSQGRTQQKELGRLAREGLRLRLAGRSDEPALEAASRILPESRGVGDKDSRRAAWLYFIGEGLRRNGDRRALRYFREALSENHFYVKAWLRLVQTLAGTVPAPKNRQNT